MNQHPTQQQLLRQWFPSFLFSLHRLPISGWLRLLIEKKIPLLSFVQHSSHELFACKSRVQEQDQIILSLRRDLAGMTARLSDIQGELSEKQKQNLERSEATIREQSKELNETRLKLAKLSDIVDQQSTQMETLQADLAYEIIAFSSIEFDRDSNF